MLDRNKQRQSWSPFAVASGKNAAILERSEAYQRVTAIAKRTGIFLNFYYLCAHIWRFFLGVFIEDAKEAPQNGAVESFSFYSHDLERYLRVQIVNNAIREIFLNQFAHMFSVYEYFFNQPSQVMAFYIV